MKGEQMGLPFGGMKGAGGREEYPRGLYGGSPPSVRTDTSVQAAESIRTRAGTLRARVVEFILLAGMAGHTDDEISIGTGIPRDTVGPRRREAVLLFLVTWKEGVRRLSRWGGMEKVWIHASLAERVGDVGGGSRRVRSPRAAVPIQAGTAKAVVLAWVALSWGSGGSTDDAGAVGTGLPLQTYKPRRGELVLEGRVKDSGIRRRTRLGKMAIVWRVT